MANVATKADLNHASTMVSQQIDHLKETFNPIKNGVYALIWLIIAAVVGGGLAFLINKPQAASSPPAQTAPKVP